DTTAQWAEYKVELIRNSKLPLYEIEDFVYNVEKFLSNEEIVIEKRGKKGITKTTDIKQSIKSYRFEDGVLFIVLKTGQGTSIPALRADVLMENIISGVPFNITRMRFFDENMKEL
ncbi:DUF2344 domain-containing protein, partial [bacterium]|nr:DUF2344 domain-containing protein [bacterium]